MTTKELRQMQANEALLRSMVGSRVRLECGNGQNFGITIYGELSFVLGEDSPHVPARFHIYISKDAAVDAKHQFSSIRFGMGEVLAVSSCREQNVIILEWQKGGK